MAETEPVRIKGLPGTTLVSPSAVLAIDDAATQKIRPVDMLNAVRPFADQPTAEAGLVDDKDMSPLRTRQTIAAIGPTLFATKAQGTKADTAVQPQRLISTGPGLTGGGDLSANLMIELDAAALASLAAAGSAVQPGRQVATGPGLTGGGDLSADRTIALAPASTAALALAGTSVQPDRLVATGAGLSGGGDLSSDRTITLDLTYTDGRYERLVNKGQANGYAPTGADNKIPIAFLPESVVGAVKYRGAWNAATNTPAIPAAAEANEGWYFIVAVAGSTDVSGITDWSVGDWIISNGTSWDKIDNTDTPVFTGDSGSGGTQGLVPAPPAGSAARPLLGNGTFAQLTAPGIADNAVTDAKFRDSAGLAVVGRPTNSTGDTTDIVAGVDGGILRRLGNVLGFGSILATFVDFIQGGANALQRPIQTYLQETLGASIAGYAGADPSGVAASDAAFNSARAASQHIVVPPGLWRLSASAVWAIETVVTFMPGAKLLVDAGVIITIRGRVYAGSGQIFSGAGSVVGISWVRPEWWGAVANGSGNQLPALDAATACALASAASEGFKPTLKLGKGQYRTTDSWVISLTSNIGIKIKGCGSRNGGTQIMSATTFPAAPVVQITGASGGAIIDWAVKDFSVQPELVNVGSATAGIQVGSDATGFYLTGVHQSLLENVLVAHYPKNYRFVHNQLVQMVRCSGFNDGLLGASCVCSIEVTGASFTGSIDINECNFVGGLGAGSSTVKLDVNGVGSWEPGVWQLAGVRLTNTLLYFGEKSMVIRSAGGAAVTDVWVNGCQIDTSLPGTTYGISIEGDGASLLKTIKVRDTYVAGVGVNGIGVFSASGATLQNIDIRGNDIYGVTNRAIVVFGTGISGSSICDNKVGDANVPGSAPIVISHGSGLVICRNQAVNLSGSSFNWLISVDPGVNHFICKDNNAGGIADLACLFDNSGAVIKATGDNIN